MIFLNEKEKKQKAFICGRNIKKKERKVNSVVLSCNCFFKQVSLEDSDHVDSRTIRNHKKFYQVGSGVCGTTEIVDSKRKQGV